MSFRLPALVPVLALVLAGAAPAQREPVLGQIELPHSYYYREMYVPQVTSGPSAAAWSPDGRELVLSMQGSLWRHELGTEIARQWTAGPDYDYQPDWSPDGRFVAYASYDGAAIELRLLEVATGATRPLTRNGAVNVDPRWSPDGTRLAFVSSVHEGRWHVHLLDVRDGEPGRAERLTQDRDSGLPRYYYSRFDHYLSPTWSPDGRELLFVSNRGRIWGTGGFWRMEARAGATPREVRYEETNWKARPDWSPDGRKVVYSSYLGRQWHQLWLMTDGGGDVFPLTYGEFDATAPRWSPDGGRIAYVSNEGGDTSLWTIELVGGRRRRVELAERRYQGPVGRLSIEVRQGDGQELVPARLSVIGPDGRSFAPDDAWRHADEAFVRAERRFEASYFHGDGRALLTVPAGVVTVEAWRGPEHRFHRAEVAVAAGATARHAVALERIADLAAEGRYGGDVHVHMNYGGAYRNDPRHLALQMRAEGLHLVESLVVNKEQRVPDVATWSPRPEVVSQGDLLIAHGQEFHTSFWGHVGLLGLREHLLLPDYSAYVNTAAASPFPHNAAVSDLARAQGGRVGYVHPFDTRPDPFDENATLSYELPVDVALGRVDYFEVMGFSDHLITSEVWYRLLNCGFRLPAAAGSDTMANFASLRGPVGTVRVYVDTGGALSHEGFLDGLSAGRSFVTNAPLLDFALDGRAPGDEIVLPAGPHTLEARVALRSSVPLDHLELIGNGAVVASVPLGPQRNTAAATLELPVHGSGWYVLRAWAERPVHPVLDLYPFASTSPIYLQVGGDRVRSREDAAFFVRWVERVAAAAEAHGGWSSPQEKQRVLADIAAARAVFVQRGGN